MRCAIIFAVLIAVVTAPGAHAQDAEKAEITIDNNRSEPLTMRFDYAFRQYTWKLIEHTIAVDDTITYRYPSNIPGCEKLRSWGITDGVLSISNGTGLLCQKRLSLCDKTVMHMDVGQKQCSWQEIATSSAR